MNSLALGSTSEVIGTILIAYAALRVHRRVVQEQRIDSKVSRAIHAEEVITIIGVGLLLVGYILQLPQLL